MRSSRRPLLLLRPDPRLREPIRRTGGRRFDLGADPHLGRDGAPSPAIRAVLREFPSAALLAAREVRPARFRDLRTLGEWGSRT